MPGRKSLVQKAMEKGDIIIHINPQINYGRDKMNYSGIRNLKSSFLSFNDLGVNIFDYVLDIEREFDEKEYTACLYDKSAKKVIEKKIKKKDSAEKVLREMYISARGY